MSHLHSSFFVSGSRRSRSRKQVLDEPEQQQPLHVRTKKLRKKKYYDGLLRGRIQQQSETSQESRNPIAVYLPVREVNEELSSRNSSTSDNESESQEIDSHSVHEITLNDVNLENQDEEDVVNQEEPIESENSSSRNTSDVDSWHLGMYDSNAVMSDPSEDNTTDPVNNQNDSPDENSTLNAREISISDFEDQFEQIRLSHR